MKTLQVIILVIEDDDDEQLLIKTTFRKIGVKATLQFANNGEEGIAYLTGKGKFSDRTAFPYPTFIMTDLKMPKMDGFSVLEHLQNNPDLAVIPTIVFSASEDLDDIKKAYLLGASSYHVKPGDADGLRNQLRLLYEYWMSCEVPLVDPSGKQLPTKSEGKLGERFHERL